MLAPALTILLSSFLLFLVQPIIAKQILPWFGGSAGVWTICLVFFQVLLLLGYGYAHWLTRRPRASRARRLHILLLLASCLTLPIIPASFWKPAQDTEPAFWILGLLTATVGLPYFLLASTAPLLQRWLSNGTNNPAHERSIYRLFALSNFGSLIGLLCYPFSIEPFATLRVQSWIWSCAYLLFVTCLVTYAWKRRERIDASRVPTINRIDPEIPPSGGLYVYWIGCAALGSALLLSVTNQITQNIASIPFLWIMPLTMYLLSFVVCFEGRSGAGWYERRFWITPAMLATGAMACTLVVDVNMSIYASLPIFIVGLFCGCVVCHGELARSKPDPNYLTHFYLSLATGGALGGLLVGLVAPQIFNSYWEMPLALIGLAVLGARACSAEIRENPKTSWSANIAIAALAAALILLLLGGLPIAPNHFTLECAKIVMGDARWSCVALLIICALLLQRYRFSRAIAVTTLLCVLTMSWNYYFSLSKGTEFVVRNFYGTLRVIDPPDGVPHSRWLKHGVIWHGSQIMQPPQSGMPTTYYGKSSGIGRTILAQQSRLGPVRIGSIGLGVGTLAVYGSPGDVFRVYELNPAVLDIARTEFTYLKDSKAQVELVLGDARLSLEREIALGAYDRPEQRFDILSIDAFSGDAIPVHLLTQEAFAIYARVVKADGVIAFHISNMHLNLAPVVEQIARNADFQAVLISDHPQSDPLATGSDWMLVTRNIGFLEQPAIADHHTKIVRRSEQAQREWTDQFSNLFQILK